MVLCLGSFMIVLDTTIVNVALPSIRADLAFTERSLALVAHAYLLVLGGILTSVFGWHSVFVVNIPVGIAVTALSLRLVPATNGFVMNARLDVGGAISVTASVMTAVYAIVNGNEAGWTSTQTLGLLGAAAILFVAFVAIESQVRDPLMPLGLFRQRNLATANVMGVLWAASMFAAFFLSALYLQLVLGYTPLQVG